MKARVYSAVVCAMIAGMMFMSAESVAAQTIRFKGETCPLPVMASLPAADAVMPEAGALAQEIEAEEAEGLTEDKIIILSGTISKKRYTKEFFNLLLESVDLKKLNDDLERKMDEKGNWFLRFDKADAIDEKLTVKDSGDSIHLKIKIAAYPAKKEIAVEKVREAILNKD